MFKVFSFFQGCIRLYKLPLFIFFIFLSFVFVSFCTIKKSNKEFVHTKFHTISHHNFLRIEREFDHIISYINNLKTLYDASEEVNNNEFLLASNNLMSLGYIDYIAEISKQGKSVKERKNVNISPQFLKSLTYKNFIQNSLYSRVLIISSLNPDGDLLIDEFFGISLPINKKNQYEGSILTIINFKKMYAKIKQGFEEKGTTLSYILDKEGKRFLHYDEEAKDQMPRRFEIIDDYFKQNKMTYFKSALSQVNNDWMVYFLPTKKLASKTRNQTHWYILLLGLILTVIASSITFICLKKLMRPNR